MKKWSDMKFKAEEPKMHGETEYEHITECLLDVRKIGF